MRAPFRRSTAVGLPVVLLLLFQASACSVLLDFEGDQCRKDLDCRRFSPLSRCDTATHLCSERTTEAGLDGAAGSVLMVDGASAGDGTTDTNSAVEPVESGAEDGSAPDAAQCDMPLGRDGASCWRCARASREEYLNACTEALCIPFDNTARLGALLVDGGLPPLPVVDAGLADASSTSGPGMGSGSNMDAQVPGPLDADRDAQGPGPDAGDAHAENATREAGPPDASASSPTTTTQYPSCESLPNAVYITGSSAAKPMLSAMALVLGAKTASPPMNLVYRSQGSCVGVDAILNNTLLTGDGASAASYWDPTLSDPALQEKKCNIPSPGRYADIGVSDVFATSCYPLPQGLPPTILDTFGPVQTMAFAVPVASSQMAISAEAAYLVFGLGGQGAVAPWLYEERIFQRNASSGTQAMIAATIGLPGSRWRGKSVGSSGDMASQLQAVNAAEDAEKTIGILATDYIDPARTTIRALAFQDFRQKCAFLPDSTAESRDKRNVRDGHYPMWGPLHLFTRLTTDALPADARAAAIVNYWSGTAALPNGTPLLPLYADKGLVPMCAMQVARVTDGGPVRRYDPIQRCGCYFEDLVGAVPACRKCSVAADCPSEAPNCSYGYCEP